MAGALPAFLAIPESANGINYRRCRFEVLFGFFQSIGAYHHVAQFLVYVRRNPGGTRSVLDPAPGIVEAKF